MNSSSCIRFLILVFACHHVKSAKICVFSVSISLMNYRSAYDPLLEKLVEHGHQVTLYSTLPLHLDNGNSSLLRQIQHIRPKHIVDHFDSFFSAVSPLKWRQEGKGHVIWDMISILYLDVCHDILKSSETQKWLSKEKGQFDLFIVDTFWNECGLGLAHAIGAKKVIYFGFHTNLLLWTPDEFGSFVESSWLPDPQFGKQTFPTGFSQRLWTTMRTLRWHIVRSSFTFFQVGKMFRKFLKVEHFPEIKDLQENVSLVLVNGHFSEEHARSLPPVIVPVGGLHIKNFQGKSASDTVKNKNVHSFLEKTKQFFLVNIGCSSDTVRNLPNDTIDSILQSMEEVSEVKFIFLWGASNDKNDAKVRLKTSNNILIEECSPSSHLMSSTLLANPNIKGFISHGDLLDIQEGIFYGVPMIILPVAFDQDSNAERIHERERGIRLEITELTKSLLTEAINDIIRDGKYKANMKRASHMFRTRQVKPLESAMWWIDYVLQNDIETLAILKPLGIHQPWYIRRSIDVWVFLLSVMYISIAILISIAVIKYFKRKKHSPRFSITGRAKTD